MTIDSSPNFPVQFFLNTVYNQGWRNSVVQTTNKPGEQSTGLNDKSDELLYFGFENLATLVGMHDDVVALKRAYAWA